MGTRTVGIGRSRRLPVRADRSRQGDQTFTALSGLLDAVRAGDGTDVLRDAMALVLQELIELEAAQAIGAGRYERTDERTTHRNRGRTRLLSTKAGDVELHVPSFRDGSFLPSLLEPRRRIDRAPGRSQHPHGRRPGACPRHRRPDQQERGQPDPDRATNTMKWS